jgi:hypothetical protein
MNRVSTGALVLLLFGCAKATPPAAPGREPSPDRMYEATATVLESKQHGPMLCLGVLLDSLPPQCGDVPIANWDWDAVEGEEHMSGTIWADFHVVGTYDGEAFTVTEVGSPRRPPQPNDDDPIEAGCPEPEGGWEFPDPDRTSEQDLQAAQRLAQGEPDFSGLWIDYLDEPQDAPIDEQRIVITATFTGDLERHEARIRDTWGGPLCVVRYERSYRDLRAIQKDLSSDDAAALGLQVLTSDVDVVDNVVDIHVVVLDDRARAALDDRYGEDTVRATAALTPVG